jgi:hypothetical protein
MKKLWTGHKIYQNTESINLWPISVTLTLEVGEQVLYLTYCIIIVSIFA